jgi:hypothetical protein
VGRRIVQRWETHEGGTDPHHLEVALTDVTRELERAMTMLAGECERRGIDPDELPSDFGINPTVTEAERLAAALVDAADALSPPRSELEEDLLETLVGGTCLLAVKTVRIAREMGSGEERPPETAGILLLLEHTRRSVDSALARLRRPPRLISQFQEAEAALWELVGPWIGGVSAETRGALQALVQAGSAPSPFCQLARSPWWVMRDSAVTPA